MFYNTGGGKFTISGGSTIQMSPPTSGTYAGITLFQDRTSNAAVTVSGGSNSTMTGTFYSPAAAATVSGNSTTHSVASEFISYDLTISGSGSVLIDPTSGSGSSPRLFGLVE